MKLPIYQYPNSRASARTAEALISGCLILLCCAAGFTILGEAARPGDAGGVLLGLALLLLGAGYAADRHNTLNAFIEVNKTRVLVVSYSFFRRREYTIPMSDIARVGYIRTLKYSTEFIALYDKDGKRLAYVLRSTDADRVFARFFDGAHEKRSKGRK